MDRVPLLGATRTRIVKALVPGRRTAVELAAVLRIQVSATRKHLEKLRREGVVEEWFERAGPGRPKKFFRLTDEGRELLPRRYDAVLNALVAELIDEGGEPALRRALARIARTLGAPMLPEPGSRRADLRNLSTALQELGFEPTVSEHGGQCTITSHNCPILRTAKAHGELVCQGLHAEIIRAATHASEVQRGKWIVDGDPVCTHTFRPA